MEKEKILAFCNSISKGNLIETLEIEFIDVDKSKIKIKFNKKIFSTDLDGNYSIDGENYNAFKFKNILAKEANNISIDLDFDETLFIDLIRSKLNLIRWL